MTLRRCPESELARTNSGETSAAALKGRGYFDGLPRYLRQQFEEDQIVLWKILISILFVVRIKKIFSEADFVPMFG
jgi:hypothetical protein